MTRSRSDSVGVRRRTAAVAVPEARDGVNLYERAAPSAQYESMIDASRDRTMERLATSPRGGAAAHKVVWLEELSEGVRQFDKFRITSQSPDGFTHEERQALEKIAYRLLPGSGHTVLFALVDQTQYDTRVCGCDLMPAQVLLVMVLYALSFALIYFLGNNLLEERGLSWYELTAGASPLDPINS